MKTASSISSRRGFLKTTAVAAAGVVVLGIERSAYAQRAAITVAQMRAGGATARIDVQVLRGGIHLMSGSGGNILVTSGPDGKLLVDSGYATSQPQIEHALSGISALPPRHLINTHWHYDHTDGNEWIHKAGAEIIAHEKTRVRMSSHQEIPAFHAILPPSPPGALPSKVFSTSETIRLNGAAIALRRYTPAHTDTDISVHFEGANILHTGDAWFNGFYPFIDYNSGGSIAGLITAATENLSLVDSSTIVVPGHGDAGQRQDLIEFSEMLQAIHQRVALLKKSGLPLHAAIASKPTVTFDRKWGGGFITPDLFTSLVYRGV